MELDFEDVVFNGVEAQSKRAKRAEVPGGWLVLMGEQLCFVPDPTHTWGRSPPDVNIHKLLTEGRL